MSVGSYPEILLYATLIVGMGLAALRPYQAFLFAAFGSSSVDMLKAFFTRSFLGPYLNLMDAFLLIMLTAVVMEVARKRSGVLAVPRPVILLAIIWFVGLVLGYATIGGFRYELLREARWALNFPLAFLVAANFITDSHRCDLFVRALFLGAIVAAGQHVLTVRNADWSALSGLSTAALVNNVRDIGFIFSPISCFFVAATQSSQFAGWCRSRLATLVWWVGLGLFTTSILLNMTRSIWISIAVSIIVLMILLRSARRLFIVLGALAILILAQSIVFQVFIPDLDPLQMIYSRYESLADEALRYQTTVTRQNDIRVESQLWWEGGPTSWLFGRGLAYYWADQSSSVYGSSSDQGENVAWGHVGYVAYLAELGVLGLSLYGVYIPLYGTRLGLNLLSTYTSSPVRLLAVLLLAVISMNVVVFALSGSYLQPETILPGLLLGAASGLLPAQKPSHSVHKLLPTSAPNYGR